LVENKITVTNNSLSAKIYKKKDFETIKNFKLRFFGDGLKNALIFSISIFGLFATLKVVAKNDQISSVLNFIILEISPKL
jgi:hypothetical protein